MTFAVGELREHTVHPEPRQRGVAVEDLVAKVANLYQGEIFTRATEKDCFGLESVVPMRLREGFEVRNSLKVGKAENQARFFGVHEIFERCVSGKEGRVQLLITGPGGGGKSTILRQLAAIWRKVQSGRELITEGEEKLCAGFNRYKLVVRIPLDKLGGERLIHWEEYLYDRLDFKDRTSFECTLKFLCKKQEVLFLLDDYNTAVRNKIDFEATGIQEILRTENWIMTSRPDCYETEEGVKPKKIEIAGFSAKDVVAYIQSYFSDLEQARSLIRLISQSPNLAEIAKMPLILEILCFNWRQNKERVFAHATPTLLFQFLVFNLLKKYLTQLGKDVRYITSLDELLTDRKVANRDLATAISIFIDVMEQMAFRPLMSDKRKSLFRRDDLGLIDLVKAAIQKANLPGVSVECTGDLVDILFVDVGLLKSVQPGEGEFLHGNLEEYFAARHLAKCMQNGLEVWPGQSWRNLVYERICLFYPQGIFRCAVGLLDEKKQSKKLEEFFSVLLDRYTKNRHGFGSFLLIEFAESLLAELKNVKVPQRKYIARESAYLIHFKQF